jgi:hypothetical protein
MGGRWERAALREDAARLLEDLGGSVGEVACSLYLMGAGGPLSRTGEPPLVRYLHAVVGADSRVRSMSVTKRWLVMNTGRGWRPTVRVRLPRPVREFACAVDRVRTREVTALPFEGEQA